MDDALLIHQNFHPQHQWLKEGSCTTTVAPGDAGHLLLPPVSLRNRHSDLLVREIHLLRAVIQAVKHHRPFHIDAWVVLPEHMHCLWTLPPGDDDFAMRWRSIKFAFSKRLADTESRTEAQRPRGERGIWQRRYWEHLIRDDLDYQRHFDYIHINPVKHGHVQRGRDWPYSSSFHRAAQELMAR